MIYNSRERKISTFEFVVKIFGESLVMDGTVLYFLFDVVCPGLGCVRMWLYNLNISALNVHVFRIMLDISNVKDIMNDDVKM